MTMDKQNTFYEIMLGAAGLMGALIFLGNKGAKSLRAGLVSIATGVAVAYYFTPVIVSIPLLESFGAATNHKTDFAIGFVLGATGWRVIEIFQKKLLKKIDDENHDSN
jgi:hypothetical protein